MELNWLPRRANWSTALSAVQQLEAVEAAPKLIELANSRIDLFETTKLDRIAIRFGESLRPFIRRTTPVKLALLGSSTLKHLVPAIRVAALRRGFMVEVFEGQYGSYQQELTDSNSDLYRFAPDMVLIVVDAQHVAGGKSASVSEAMDMLKSCWALAKEKLGAAVIQQTVLPIFPALLGNNEHHLSSSPSQIVTDVNAQLRKAALDEGVHLLSIDALASKFGISKIYSPTLWCQSKQEISPLFAPYWGDQVGRILGALRGQSYKCLVLDLDNTLWGGVIGDDGVEGIRLGQGDAVGESHLLLQKYAAALADRGIILAVCSKNEDSNARAVFEKHPEMVLRIKDIACFVANWDDKATNLRRIAKDLNIGLDSLVFVDDNPFERNLIRSEIPEVAVPEMPDDPARFAEMLAEAGYFEALSITAEDRERNDQYKVNTEREQLRHSVTNMDSYLRKLEMKLIWSPFDAVGQERITQLINKSNQFNLTTRRYTHERILALIDDPSSVTLQLRLIDKFGDNGMIAVIIGKISEAGTLELDTWLMSCRVLGRQVEEATLNILVERALSIGVHRLIGCYIPSIKNQMVRDHYKRLGFTLLETAIDGSSKWELEIEKFAPLATFIETTGVFIDERPGLYTTQ